jgi:hypothetical protein
MLEPSVVQAEMEMLVVQERQMASTGVQLVHANLVAEAVRVLQDLGRMVELA